MGLAGIDCDATFGSQVAGVIDLYISVIRKTSVRTVSTSGYLVHQSISSYTGSAMRRTTSLAAVARTAHQKGVAISNHHEGAASTAAGATSTRTLSAG
jgi:hypothetical protein